ncbi:Helix-turn-helix domain protein [compost metagenome]
MSAFYEPIGPLSDAPPLKIAGLVVRGDMIRKNGAAFCSECWHAGHEHYIKDLKLARYCPYHFRRYLTHCPNCHINLCWHAPLYRHCRCKYELISPPCLPNEAAIEQKLLDIFRAKDTERFNQLVKYLQQLGYRRNFDTSCPVDRCLLSMAFALLDEDMMAVLDGLRRLHIFYPDVPKRIILAKIALIRQPKLRSCARIFLSHNPDNCFREETHIPQPIPHFTVSQPQIGAWLKLPQHHWKTVWKFCEFESNKGRYSWEKAQIIAEHVLRIKLRSGFKKKKTSVHGITTKELQHKLLLSAGVIKGAVKEGLLTPISGWDRKVFFAFEKVKQFSENFVSIQLLSTQSNIPTQQIHNAIKRLKIPDLEFENRTLRRQLISTQTSRAIIEWDNTNSQRRKRKNSSSPLSSSLPRYTPPPAEAWLSTSATAELLGVCDNVVRRLIKAGLLHDARRKSKGAGYLININAINEFKTQHVSTTEAATLLNCNRQVASKVLASLGVSPITGPGVDDNPVNFYYRRNVLDHVCTVRQLRRENNMGYTILETQRILNISTPTISTMVRTGLFKLVDRKLPGNRLIKKNYVDKFYENYAKPSTIAKWLKIPHAQCCLQKILNRFDIHPISGPSVDASQSTIYAIDDIAKIFHIPIHTEKYNSKCKPNTPFIRVSTLWKKYDIGGNSFGQMFLTSGFVDPIRVGATTYLTHSDASKVESILDKYCTCAQANRYLKHPQLATNLVTKNRIDSVYPLKGYWDHPMILKAQLKDYAIRHRHT